MDANATATPPTKQPTSSERGNYSASALATGAKLKEFVVTGIIGEGGFGIVYSADDTLLQRNVAIKEYMPAAIANRQASSHINLRSVRHQQTFAAGMQGFIDEARLLAQFKHPALVEILRFWEANGTAYMVMPHYSGKTLRNLLKTSRNLCSERWLKCILGPVLDAIELLHTNHIYHRDIAPDNIVIQDNGQPVLLDLGSARRVIAGMQSALTVVVKPCYAPIEQYTEDTANEQGPWTDIYALGAVLHFAITGSAPAASVSRMMRDSLKLLNISDYPQYSESFLSAINKALALRPCDRFQSVADFRDALTIHTSLTGNTPLVELAQENAKNQKGNANHLHKDDEITLILSEDEISVFKEKLLQSLQSPATNSRVNDNILQDHVSPKKDTSISTFADVKDLIENTQITNSNKDGLKKATTNNAQNAEDQILKNKRGTRTTQQNSAPMERRLIALPLVIVLSALAGIILAVAFVVTDSNSNDEKTSRHAIEELQQDETSVEAAIALSQVKNYDLLHNQNIAEHAIENNYLTTPPSSIAGQQESPIIMEAGEANQNKSEEISAVRENSPAQKTIDESENISTQNNAQPKDNNTPITSNSIAPSKVKTVESAAQAVQMSSIKVTLVPWGEIWIDNQRYGVSPPLREILLAPGNYTIELRNPGLATEIRTIHFEQGDKPVIYHNFTDPKTNPVSAKKETNNNESIEAEDKKSEQTAAQTEAQENSEQKSQPQENSKDSTAQPITKDRTLNIKVIPWGEIYLDGKMKGVTPPLRQITLTPGDHIIEIRHPSYATKTIKIDAEDPASETLEHHFQ